VVVVGVDVVVVGVDVVVVGVDVVVVFNGGAYGTLMSTRSTPKVVKLPV